MYEARFNDCQIVEIMKSINCTFLLAFLLGLGGYTKEAFDVDFDRKQDESPKFKLKGSWRVENQEHLEL